MSEEISIREWQAGDSVAAITALLHAAYAPLAAQGLRYLASHQDDAMTLRRLKRGMPMVAEKDGEVIGTVTLYGSQPDSPCEWYRRPEACHFAQFAVRPDLQGGGIGRRLYQAVEAKARALGAGELAMDTAEDAQELRRWYERLGFRFVQLHTWEVTNYLSVVLSKTLR